MPLMLALTTDAQQDAILLIAPRPPNPLGFSPLNMRKVNSTQANVAGHTSFEQQMCSLKGNVHPITCHGHFIPGNEPVPFAEKVGWAPGLV